MNAEKDLRKLIGEEKWKQVQKKSLTLEEMRYLVVCETCGKIFFEITLAAVHDMMLKGKWHPEIPQLWYVEAARHWVPQTFHAVRVYVAMKGDRTLVKDLSAEWTAQIPAQKRTVEKLNQVKKQKVTFEEAMLNELCYLEKQIKQRS